MSVFFVVNMKHKKLFLFLSIISMTIICITCCNNSKKIQKEMPKVHTFVIEDIDSEVNLYRIDIVSKDKYVEEPYIDYNIRVKFQTIILRETHKDSIINMILEELPEDPISITVQYNS